MRLFRIGTITINFEHVTAVRGMNDANSAALCIYLSDGRKLELGNPTEVALVRAWILNNSEPLPAGQ
jgi:hypothetical protein